MRLLIVDTETTGLSPEDGAVCIEVAAMVYDTKFGSIESFSSLIRHDSNAAEHINRIPVGALLVAPEADRVWERVQELWETCDTFCAHRAEFDRKFVTPGMRSVSSHPGIDTAAWICTKVDVDWPGGHRGDHLVHLALAYGLGVASAHRAMTDVDHIARIFTRIAESHDLEAMLVRAMRPKKKYIALVSYDMKQLAKDAGFMWNDYSQPGHNKEYPTKSWYRAMPPEDAEALSFRVKEIE
jgi:DNA polymerase-3 subunit epsilon